MIFGLGMMSLATDTDVIDTPGLSVVPGVIGILSSVAGFALVLGPALRAPHPSFFAALWAALAAALAYLAGVWISALVSGADSALATSVIGRLAVGWAAPVVAIAALHRGLGGDRRDAHPGPPAPLAVGAERHRRLRHATGRMPRNSAPRAVR